MNEYDAANERQYKVVEARRPGLFMRILTWLVRLIDGLRKVMHLVFLFLVLPVLLAVFAAVMTATPPMLKDRSVLMIQPVGYLVEQHAGSAFDRAMQELMDETPMQTVVQDVVDALEHAGHDRRIEAVHLELSGLAGGGLSKLQRIAEAMAVFQESGKPIIASGDFFSQGGYYLAAHADEVYLHPEGVVFLPGYGVFKTYYKNAIDMLRLDWNIFRVGTHKSFVEPYIRMDMSDEDKEDINNLAGQLWSMYDKDTSAARGLEPGSIHDFSQRFLDHVENADGDMATAALSHGLVDGLMTHKQLRDRLIELAGAEREFPDEHNWTDMRSFLAEIRTMNGVDVRSQNIGVIVAAGDITFGSPPPGTIGSESTSLLLRRALHDDSVKAIVLRIDSPGGSAFASDVIANEIDAIKAAGKPVVASMSSVAASGGYWIAAGADRILASPSTITGSIGIFGMLPTYQRTLEALGVNVDGVGTTIWAGELRPDREMGAHAKQLFQTIIEDGYRDFLTRVSVTRGLDIDALDAIAQGRVWTGVDALDRGLVDELGNLNDAVTIAAELSGLAEGSYGTRFIEEGLSPTEQLIVELLESLQQLGMDPRSFSRRPSQLEKVAGKLEQMLTPMLNFNDPRGVYAHCLCSFE